MGDFELVRRSVLADGKSRRKVGREMGIDRRVVGKMLEFPEPPGYRLSSPRPKRKLGPFLSKIEKLVFPEVPHPVKQVPTGQRIFELLVKDHGYTGGSTQVRGYVAELRARPVEAFVPLAHLPGEAQADFYESTVEIAGKRCKAFAFLMVLPHSGVYFQACYPAENAESFADGHDRAFRFFGGVPRRCIYDNPAYSVKRGTGPLTGRERSLTDSFGVLQSAYLFKADFAAPASGNEKGSVERKVGTLRRSLMVPVPKAGSFEELNKTLLDTALAFKAKAELFEADARRFLPVPDYEPSRLVEAKVDKTSLVRFETNSYSVPTELVGRSVLVRAKPFEIEILSKDKQVAVHVRSTEKGRAFAQIAHYLDLLERKPRAVRTALAVVQAGLPLEFEAYYEKNDEETGISDLRFVGVLRLSQEFGVDRVAIALRTANARGVKEPADIRCLLMRESAEAPSSRLCIVRKPPEDRKCPRVEHPPLSEYGRLLVGAL